MLFLGFLLGQENVEGGDSFGFLDMLFVLIFLYLASVAVAVFYHGYHGLFMARDWMQNIIDFLLLRH